MTKGDFNCLHLKSTKYLLIVVEYQSKQLFTIKKFKKNPSHCGR